MEHVDSLLDLVAGKVTEVAQSDVVVGDPIELGDVTLVPLSRVSLGFGGGGGEGEGTQGPRRGHWRSKGNNGGAKAEARFEGGEGKGTGLGGGGGGKVRPVGVIVFTSDGVSVEPIPDKLGVFDKIFEKVPDIIDLIKDAKAG
jgi:uncharacterized spore protein YtfJ